MRHDPMFDSPCMEFRRREEPDCPDHEDVLQYAIDDGYLEKIPNHYGSHEDEVFVEVWWDSLLSAGFGVEAGRVLAEARYYQKFEDGKPYSAHTLWRLQERANNAWGDIVSCFELDGRRLQYIGDSLYWVEKDAPEWVYGL